MSKRNLLIFSLLAIVALSACKKKPAEVIAPPPFVPEAAPPPETPKPAEVMEMSANFSRVFFDFDQAFLTSEGKAALRENASIMQKATDLKLEIQGHADERGTTEYNLTLGQKRADAVYRFLISEGVAPSRLATISYGEEKPLEGRTTEVAWSKNRRAEFRITWGTTQGVQGTTN